MKRLLTLAVALVSLSVCAQPEKKSVVIGELTEKPSALLIINPPDSDQGVLLPQLSTVQRMALTPTSPAEDGLIVFDKDLANYYYWSNNAWIEIHTSKTLASGFIIIDPASFQPLKKSNQVRHSSVAIFEDDDAFVTVTNKDWGKKIIAPVSIPHGATVSDVSIHYMDHDPQGNIKVTMLRQEFGKQPEAMFTWESNSAPPTIRKHSVNTFNGMETIDLGTYTYRMIVEFDIDNDNIDEASDARQRIYGVRIQYLK